jgi:hypothetical protein
MEVQREPYNAALEERRGAWRWEQRSISRFEQFGALTGWEHPVLTAGVTVFCVDVMANRREPTGKVAGIDLGVNELVATSDGQLIGNPRHLRGCLEALADLSASLRGASADRSGAARPPTKWDACTARSPTSAVTAPTRSPAAWSTTTT